MENKIWFITGASSGFGKELALAVIKKGGKVIATFRKQEQLDEFENIDKQLAFGYLLDVTDFSSVNEVIKQIFHRFERVDVVVNAAGQGFAGVVEEVTLDEARKVMDINFFGTLAVTKAFLPYMRNQRSGHIIQYSSTAGFSGTPTAGLYSASKFAVEGFSEALAGELTPFNIKVTIVEPGAFRTDFMTGMGRAANPLPEYEGSVAHSKESHDQFHNHQPGDPAKAAQAIIKVVASPDPPLRLVLGHDSFQSAKNKLSQVADDLNKWESVSLSTNVD